MTSPSRPDSHGIRLRPPWRAAAVAPLAALALLAGPPPAAAAKSKPGSRPQGRPKPSTPATPRAVPQQYLTPEELSKGIDDIWRQVEGSQAKPALKINIHETLEGFRSHQKLTAADVRDLAKYYQAQTDHAFFRDRWLSNRDDLEALDSSFKNLGAMRRAYQRIKSQDSAFRPEVSVSDVLLRDVKENLGERQAAFLQMGWGGMSTGGSSDDAGVILRGMRRLDRGNSAGAAEDFEQVLAKDPRNVPALLGLAEARYASGDYPAAKAAAEQALSLDPGNRAAVAVLRSIGDRPGPSNMETSGPSGGPGSGPGTSSGGGSSGSDPARPSGTPLFGLGGSRAPPAVGPGVEVVEAGRAREAERLSREAAEKLRIRDYNRMLALANLAIGADPRNAAAHYYKALALFRLGRREQALEAAEAGLRNVNSPALREARSLALSGLGRHEEGKRSADEAIAMDGDRADSWNALAYAQYGLKDHKGMVFSMQKAAELDPAQYLGRYKFAATSEPGDDLTGLFGEDSEALQRLLKAAEERNAARRQGKFSWLYLLAGAGLLLVLLGAYNIFFAAGREKAGEARTTGVMPAKPSKASKPAAAAARRGDEPPEVIAGGYQVLRKIGAGGMGTVYEALDLQLERPVAVKRMREEIRVDPRERERFLKEARTVAAMRHPNIVEIFSIVDELDEVYLIFEYVEGLTFDDMLARSGKLSFDEARKAFRQVCAALEYAHGRGVIHRDLKPSNIMVAADGVVKVMDFGVARRAKDAASKLSMTNTVAGTPPYMAPEAEQGIVRKESDIFSLGACLYEVLTGQMPFSGTGAGMLLNKINMSYVPPSQMAKGLPPGLDALVASAMQPDPDKRIRTPKAFLDALDAL